MTWICGQCGRQAMTNRRKCPRCGNALWKPTVKKDLAELAGPMKRIAPRGLLLVNPEKKTQTRDSSGIECGKCHVMIYNADERFDTKSFDEARKRHYLVSPACEEKK